MAGGGPVRAPASRVSRATASAVGRAYMPNAATSGRDERQDALGEDLELGGIPVERVQDQVIDAAQRLDLAPDPLGARAPAPALRPCPPGRPPPPRRAGRPPASTRDPCRCRPRRAAHPTPAAHPV